MSDHVASFASFLVLAVLVSNRMDFNVKGAGLVSWGLLILACAHLAMGAVQVAEMLVQL